MILNIDQDRNWRVISKSDARAFLKYVYNFLDELPQSINVIEGIILSPQWTVSDGRWQVCGVRGSLRYGSHRILFEYGNIPQRNSLKVQHVKGENFDGNCSFMGRKSVWQDPTQYFLMFVSILRTTLKEDLDNPKYDDETQRERMGKLIVDPDVIDAQFLVNGKRVGD